MKIIGKEIDSIISAKSEDTDWAREILKRANVVSSSTEYRLHDEGQADDIFDICP